jgi:hypothetical protein
LSISISDVQSLQAGCVNSRQQCLLQWHSQYDGKRESLFRQELSSAEARRRHRSFSEKVKNRANSFRDDEPACSGENFSIKTLACCVYVARSFFGFFQVNSRCGACMAGRIVEG